MRSTLENLSNRDDVVDVWLHIADIEDGAPVAEGVIVRSIDPEIDLEPFRRKLNGDATMDGPDEVVRGLPDAEKLTAKMIFWD